MKYKIYEKGKGIIAVFYDLERAIDYFDRETGNEQIIKDSSGLSIESRKAARNALLSGKTLWAGKNGGRKIGIKGRESNGSYLSSSLL